MYYEIYFEPSVGKWRIRITTTFLFFYTSKVVHTSVPDRPDTVPVEFDSYLLAVKYADEQGFSYAYDLLDRRSRVSHALRQQTA